MSRSRWALAAILLLYAVMAAVGITWGLPTARNDRYLFGDEPPWPGEKIARLAKTSRKESTTRGADVDADPLNPTQSGPIDLTATEEDAAAIYLRFRLYTHQPDEMITMMALAGMKPRQLQLDPKLYQYGGLFIYPVGAAIAIAGKLGLVHVTSDLTWYLDHPNEFGKFYIIARAYVALWGALGVVLVYAIANRLHPPLSEAAATKNPPLLKGGPGGVNPQFDIADPKSQIQNPNWSGILAGLLFTLMPITVCMSHEAKPHLPGAVLMLAAVWFAMKYVQNSEFKIQNAKMERRAWYGMCACCGAAFGMVLSALPIFVLIPLAEWLRRRAWKSRLSNLRSQISDLNSQMQDDPAAPAASESPEPPSPRESGNPKSNIQYPKSVLLGVVFAFAVYLVTNPYILINALTNREVLLSNLRNSTAMYEAGRVGQGLLRAIELIAEGASPILLVGGVASMALLAICRLVPRRSRIRGWHGSAAADPCLPATRSLISVGPLDSRLLPLIVTAAVFFVQFALLAAGKPAEYGRFGVFIDAALAILTAVAFAAIAQRVPRRLLLAPLACLVASVGYFGWPYLHNFRQDASPNNTREKLAIQIQNLKLKIQNPESPLSPQSSVLSTLSDPAPYNCPPMNFAEVKLWRYPSLEAYLADPRGPLLRTADDDPATLLLDDRWQVIHAAVAPPYSPISWANKPFTLAYPSRDRQGAGPSNTPPSGEAPQAKPATAR